MSDRFAIAALRAALLLCALAGVPDAAHAEWQIKPFAGATFRGSTTLLDLEAAASSPNPIVGASAVLLGDVVGAGVDVGHARGFFERGDQNKLLSSAVTTISGNIVVAAPRRLTQYTLRPYFVGGVGLMRIRTENPPTENTLDLESNLLALDVGGGVTGMLTDRVGLGWELRRFRSVRGDSTGDGRSIGPERLSFWRATMAVVIRY